MNCSCCILQSIIKFTCKMDMSGKIPRPCVAHEVFRTSAVGKKGNHSHPISGTSLPLHTERHRKSCQVLNLSNSISSFALFAQYPWHRTPAYCKMDCCTAAGTEYLDITQMPAMRLDRNVYNNSLVLAVRISQFSKGQYFSINSKHSVELVSRWSVSESNSHQGQWCAYA